MARVTTTGKSALIDPYGAIIKELEIGAEGVIDASLPQALAPPPFALWGDGAFWAMWACFAAFASITRISLIFRRSNF